MHGYHSYDDDTNMPASMPASIWDYLSDNESVHSDKDKDHNEEAEEEEVVEAGQEGVAQKSTGGTSLFRRIGAVGQDQNSAK